VTDKTEKIKTGTFQQFKDYTLAVARGERKVDPNEPRIWIEREVATDVPNARTRAAMESRDFVGPFAAGEDLWDALDSETE
jgi:hypothetical protein